MQINGIATQSYLKMQNLNTAKSKDSSVSPSPSGIWDNLKDSLDLSDSQMDQIQQILTDNLPEVDSDTSAKQFSSQDADSMKALQKSINEKISSVLDDDQKEKFSEILAQRDKMQANPPQNGKQPDMQNTLDLSDDQEEKIKSIFQDAKEKMKSKIGSNSFSDRDSSSLDDIINEFNSSINSILTDSQKEKLEEIQNEQNSISFNSAGNYQYNIA